MLTDQQREDNRRRVNLATDNARKVLKPGDKIRVSKCPGTKRWIYFSHWEGSSIVSKSGISDYCAVTIDRLNGQPIDFCNTTAGDL